MLTAVKIEESAESRLEELQSEIRLQTGGPSPSKRLTRPIDQAYESRGDVIDSLRESTVPLSEAERDDTRWQVYTVE